MSGVYIKGLKMPSECFGLRLIIYPNGSVLFPHSTYFEELNGVKAIHVPDHGRLIDADMMERECCHGCKNEFHKYENCIDCVLANAPTIIPSDKESGE